MTRKKVEIDAQLSDIKLSVGLESWVFSYKQFAPTWSQSKLYAREIEFIKLLRKEHADDPRIATAPPHLLLAHFLGLLAAHDYNARHHIGRLEVELLASEGPGAIDPLWNLVEKDHQPLTHASMVLTRVRLYQKHSRRSFRDSILHICTKYIPRDAQGQIIKGERDAEIPSLWSDRGKDMIEAEAFEWYKQHHSSEPPSERPEKPRRPPRKVPIIEYKDGTPAERRAAYDTHDAGPELAEPVSVLPEPQPEPVASVEPATPAEPTVEKPNGKPRAKRKKPEPVEIERDIEPEKLEVAAIRERFTLWMDDVLKRVPELDRLTLRKETQDEFANLIARLRRSIAHKTRGLDLNNRRDITRAFESLDLQVPRPGERWDLTVAKNRYKRLAAESHPDRGGDHEVYLAVTDAYVRIEQLYKLHDGRMP
jgi:hypothetical protein